MKLMNNHQMNTTSAVMSILCALSMIISACTTQEAFQVGELPFVSGDTVRLTAKQLATAGLLFASAEEREITTGLRVAGMVHVPPQYVYSITAPLGGVVRSSGVLPGSPVRKGETLVVIENPEFITLQQEYLSTLAQLIAVELEFTRQTHLSADSIYARRKLEAITADVQSLRIRRKALAEKLALINVDVRLLNENTLSRAVRIPAPINGYVTKVNVNNGSYIAPNVPAMEIVNTDHMHIELAIFERDIQKLRVNQAITVFFTDAPQQPRAGHIHLIGKAVGADRTVVVHAHLNTPDPSLTPGTTLTAVIDSDIRKNWVVPEAAVVSYDGKYYVFTGSPSQCVRMEIQVGITQNGLTEILNNPEWLSTERVLVVGAPSVLGAMMAE